MTARCTEEHARFCSACTTARAYNSVHCQDCPEGRPSAATEPASSCPVAYCRAEAGHRDLHDIPACLKTCAWIVVGVSRQHDPACPNAKWVPAHA